MTHFRFMLRGFLAVAASLSVALAARTVRANALDDGENLPVRIMNAQMAKELRSRASRLGASAGDVDTTYVGFTPGHSADNYWSIWSGSDKFSVPSGPYHRPPAKGAMWDFEPPYTDVHGDSMQGWWAVRKEMTGTGGLTIPDYNRPWRAIDFGNMANHVFGADKRTFGVIGVWHVDGGSSIVAPSTTTWTGEAANSGGVTWAPLTGAKSAWMGLRRHGDTSHIDDVALGGTGNHFNEDVLQFKESAAISPGGSDKKFPGYGGQMDQMLYRDIDVTGVGDLTVSFQYRTNLSTSFGTNDLTRTGWFQHDPLTVITGGSNPNFISNHASVAAPPCDSFMVYVGAPAEGSVTLSDGASHTIHDAKRRWFGEVIRSNEGLYKQIFSAGGNNATTTTPDLVIPAATLAPIKAAGANRVRLVFRVKTNFGSDDGVVTQGFSSGGGGAAIVDEVKIKKDAGPLTTIGSFEAVTDIDNSIGVPAETKWKSTGKPPQPFYHSHFLSNGGPSPTLQYQDLCGQVGNPARICDMQGFIVSAGEHDFNERSGGTFGTAEQERFQGLFSPVIQLAAGVTENSMGLTAEEADGTEDYYLDYEIYTGLFDFSPSGDGNGWRFGVVSYPGGSLATGAGEHPRWGTPRLFGILYANGPHQCFRNLDGLKGLMRTSSPDGIPDSIRLFLKIRQEAYRFGIPQSEFLDGAYWDNLSLAIVDGAPEAPLSVDIWQLYHDTFPSNDDPGLVGVPAAFDTTTALIKNGLNNAPATGNANRFNVPGDTTQVYAEGDDVRIDLVFRILPGPGNYVNAALGVNSQLRAVPYNPGPIPTPAAGVANFWSNYMASNGANGSPGGHPTASGGPLAGQKIWSPQVWNSARMDTAQANVFQLQGRGILTPGNSGIFMTAYHEEELTDPHRGVLGISRNICFVADTSLTVSTQTVICGSGAVPAGVVYPPVWTSAPGSGFNGATTTKEGTKIIPDGLLTPGSHVQYFFRRKDGLSPIVTLAPDTNIVIPQSSEYSTDGHRWQQFGVLPDRWKSPAYTHPVLGTPGRGDACMLFIDQCDRRGDELTWVGVADSIGATRTEKHGAHNGWHAYDHGDINDPQYFVRRHVGQPGTTWDMLGVKAAESGTAGTGSIGSRGGVSAYSFNNPANTQINGKTSRQGPSFAMLNAYYKLILLLSGDLNSTILGPFRNKSQNDYKALQDFMLSGDPGTPTRGYWQMGEGLIEDMNSTAVGFTFMANYLGVDLINSSYLAESGNTNGTVDLISTPIIEGDSQPSFIYGIRNACSTTLDVLDDIPTGAGVDADPSMFYENVGANGPYIAGVRKAHSVSNPWIALTDGWRIDQLLTRDGVNSHARLHYFYEVFNNVFSAICDVQGFLGPLDTPNNDDGRLYEFLSLANNPLKSGATTVTFGMSKAERVKIQVFDVSGRVIRTLADRVFAAGEHRIRWDGIDDAGKPAARGVYFVRSVHADSGFEGKSKLVILK